MSLLGVLGREFDSGSRSRGQKYFNKGLVEITHRDANRISARVQGHELYTVEINLSSGEPVGECTCPYAEQYGPCKHLWATFLAAEDAGLLGGLPLPEAPTSTRLETARTLLERYVESKPQPGKISAPHAHPKAPAWKRQIAELRRVIQQGPGTPSTPKPWPANRRVAYLIDLLSTSHQHGALTIKLATQVQERTGSWGLPKPSQIKQSQIATFPDEEDRLIVQMLSGLRHSQYYGDHDAPLEQGYALAASGFELILRRICQTGKCYAWREDENGTFCQRLAWDDGTPWELWLEVRPDAQGERYVLEGSLRRGESRIDCREPLLALAHGLVIVAGQVARLQHFEAFPILEFIRRGEHKISLAAAQADEMLGELLALSPLPKLDLPPELRVENITPSMKPRLRIKAPPKRQYDNDQKLIGELSFDYDGRVIPEKGGAALFDANARTLLRRDAVAEASAMARLDELRFKVEWDYYESGQQRRLHPSKLSKVVLQLSGEGWLVEAEGKLYRQPGEFKVEITSGIDWFELEGSVDFGDGLRARLPRLLAALRRGEKTVQLDDGTVGVLPEQWLAKYGLLARIAKDDDEHVRFSRGQVGLLDALAASLPQATCDAVFEQARAELCRFEGVAAADPPEGFVGTLRPYQRDGLGWLQFLNRFGFGGCLADDMGLGKTVQVLAFLESRRQTGKPSLVVVPKSLVFNWIEEAKRFTPQLRVLDHTGIARARSTEAFASFDVILTTYGTMRLDAPFLKDYTFDYAILDEAQAIKNGSSESAKAARLIRADHRLVLSGTPVQNHLGELWSLFEFLNPGMLGGASVFKISGAGAQQVEQESRELLSRALRPFILRRTKEQVAPDLPAKTEQTLWCDLEPQQRKLYDELRDHYRASLLDRIATEGINKAKIQILEALLRLRQAAIHPGLIDKDRANESSAKLDLLLPQIAEVIDEGHKVLVFSQFTSMLAIVKKHLDKQKIAYEYLDGQTKDRQARVERFQTDPTCKLFLISLKAGGLGLNLTAAEYVFLLDPWWNPAVESQAIDRAHRIGQTRHVFAYRLIARGTVEEKVLELQSRKKDLADMILNADKGLISQLGREDLELLLS